MTAQVGTVAERLKWWADARARDAGRGCIDHEARELPALRAATEAGIRRDLARITFNAMTPERRRQATEEHSSSRRPGHRPSVDRLAEALARVLPPPRKTHEKLFPPWESLSFLAGGDHTSRAAYRRELHRLANRARPHQRWRARGCGIRRIQTGSVELRRAEDGRAHACGVLRCGSVWECPRCSSRIRSARAEELTTAAARWREAGGEVYMLTTTIRHGWGDSLKRLRRGVTDAWGRLIGGAPWLRIANQYGIVGYVRALELTDGPNGWHPHLHVLLFTMRELGAGAQERLRERIADRWATKVRAALGSLHEPRTDAVGCDLRESRSADYLSAMGLEVAGQLTKCGRDGHRTPWELIDHDAQRWKAYVAGIRGAQMLVWSNGLRDALLGDVPTDEELSHPVTIATVAAVPQDVWDQAVKAGHELALLEAAERGPEHVVRLLRSRLGSDAAELAAIATADALEHDTRRRALEATRRQLGMRANEARWTGVGALG